MLRQTIEPWISKTILTKSTLETQNWIVYRNVREDFSKLGYNTSYVWSEKKVDTSIPHHLNSNGFWSGDLCKKLIRRTEIFSRMKKVMASLLDTKASKRDVFCARGFSVGIKLNWTQMLQGKRISARKNTLTEGRWGQFLAPLVEVEEPLPYAYWKFLKRLLSLKHSILPSPCWSNSRFFSCWLLKWISTIFSSQSIEKSVDPRNIYSFLP